MAYSYRGRPGSNPNGSAENKRAVRAPGQGEQSRQRISWDLLAHLTNLLGATPVDLARISNAIRAYSDLEHLVMRLAISLGLSPEGSVTTLEEAALVLGTDRLRVMLYMWSLLAEDDGPPKSAGAGEQNPTLADNDGVTRHGACLEPIPEALYLSCFSRWLGLDSANPTTSGINAPCFALGSGTTKFAELRELFMRDFLALIPILDPGILHRHTNDRS
jgi:hypothetical protein